MKKAYLGVLLFVIAAVVLYGMIFDYGKWWMLINILTVVVNVAGGVMLLKENTR
jgi:uncharacterized protein (DUF58 family)